MNRRGLAICLIALAALTACDSEPAKDPATSTPMPTLSLSSGAIGTFPRGEARGSSLTLKVWALFASDVRHIGPCRIADFENRPAYAYGCEAEHDRFDQDTIFVVLQLLNSSEETVRVELDRFSAVAEGGRIYQPTYIGTSPANERPFPRSASISPGRRLLAMVTFQGQGKPDVVAVSYHAGGDEDLRIDFVGDAQVHVLAGP
jgi:hypothetical protein